MRNRTAANDARNALIQDIDETNVPYGMVALWCLGQASFIVKGGSTTIYIDPFTIEDALVESRHGLRRAYPSAVRPEDITNADYCLITHDHVDHLDPDTIQAMAAQARETLFFAPACCREMMLGRGVSPDRLHIADTGKEYSGQAIIKPIAAAHEELSIDQDGFHEYVGYIIRLNGVTLYHAGDTLIYEGLQARLREEEVDLGLLPINGRDFYRGERGIVGNMNYREAAELANGAGFKMTVPMHYDLFAGNAERPGYFVDYVYDHFPSLPIHVMARGERFIYAAAGAVKS
ncbi:MBL fold metallo-hydrolase [Paenibacillus chibensis]|uniref:MBL fold metallo-hydrolase n=1 Tax=Paenibacillus chibensis TaxID=59846 RepID=A0ABU6PN41_9BACL|nr:MBL fold metallo-hydrolase [Paenibacillus chibensis]